MLVPLFALVLILGAVLPARLRRSPVFTPINTLLFAVAMLWCWANACGALTPFYERALKTRCWQPVPQSWNRHPVIVLLGGGTERTGRTQQLRPEGDSIEKVALAARLYQVAAAAHADPILIVSGGDPERHGLPEADVYTLELVKLGVPAHAIVRENRSWNTYQNAKYVAALLRERHFDQVLLVTTALHMMRARINFARFHLQVIPLSPPVPAIHFGLVPTLDNLAVAEGALHELAGVVKFYSYRALRIY